MMMKEGQEKTCSVCNQRFNSDHDLREHQEESHSQPQSGESGYREGYGADADGVRKSAWLGQKLN
jgi:hypothetical protein